MKNKNNAGEASFTDGNISRSFHVSTVDLDVARNDQTCTNFSENLAMNRSCTMMHHCPILSPNYSPPFSMDFKTHQILHRSTLDTNDSGLLLLDYNHLQVLQSSLPYKDYSENCLAEKTITLQIRFGITTPQGSTNGWARGSILFFKFSQVKLTTDRGPTFAKKNSKKFTVKTGGVSFAKKTKKKVEWGSTTTR